MGDERLRNKERRWRETGAPADGRVLLVELERAGASPPRLLRARVQVGELAEGRLRLAALLGDRAAQEALGEPAPRGALRESALAWVAELGSWGPEPWPLVAMAVARLLEAEFQGEAPPALFLREACQAVAALLRDPRALRVSEVLRLHEAIGPEVAPRTRRVEVALLRGRGRWWATYAARNVVEVALALVEGRRPEAARSPARSAAGRAIDALVCAELARDHEAVAEVQASGAEDDAQAAAHTRLRAAVRAELLPWALGTPPRDSRPGR